MRQTQGSMICPHCEKLISVSEERCPFCGAWRPGLYGYTPLIQRLFGRLDFVRVITAGCITLYVLSLVLDPSSILGGGGMFNFLSPSGRSLLQLGMTSGPAMRAGFWWTLLTAIYLHGSLLHIFFNMMVFRNVGPGVASVFGPARSFVIWTLAGAIGFLVSNLITGSPSVGASGSVFGLFAALIVYGRRVGHSMLTRQIWQWVIINFVIGFFIANVNVVAHAGGFAGGWIAAEAMRLDHERRESPAVQVLAVLLVIATVAGFVLSFVKVTALFGMGGG
jgi:rhomboid protease GluP